MTHKEVAELIMSFGENNDGTAYPYWGVSVKAGFGQVMMLAGPFFSRASADEHFGNKRHRYPKTAFVYCFSAHMSYDYRKLMDWAKDELRQNPPEKLQPGTTK